MALLRPIELMNGKPRTEENCPSLTSSTSQVKPLRPWPFYIFRKFVMKHGKGLSVLLGLALVLTGTGYWVVLQLIDKQHESVKFHFAKLLENIHEHESFLRAVAKQSATDELSSTDHGGLFTQRPLPDEGPDFYEGQEFSFSIPFSLGFNQQKLATSELAKVFTLGKHLATVYSAFWVTSPSQAPQVFLFDSDGSFRISVPATGYLRSPLRRQDNPFKASIEQALQHRLIMNDGVVDGKVHWENDNLPADDSAPARLSAYINIHLKPERVHIQGASHRMLVTSLLNMEQINNARLTMEGLSYDHFTLITPSGAALAGSLQAVSSLREGPNVTADGIVFKVSADGSERWSALYTTSFNSYLGYAMWPLLALLVLLLAVSGCGWAFSRWYKRRVVLPVRKARQSLAESEAFSRVVIDTAPMGMGVMRRSDFKVLLANQSARQWQGTSELAALRDRYHDFVDAGETCLDIKGRHLQIGFTSTRYQGQEVLLCAFNDVTCHIEKAAALEQAERSADAANETKTLFLATINHEIRTPLYGVLGTLELLGLTRLNLQQQEYLQTIQRASTTLLQLISDVLDVTKIESGQMAIESMEFCPLEMIEDALHAYAAFAEHKGLLLYACIDASLPNLMVGDPLRIRQILNNLLSNAIKFTDTGRVVLRVRVLETHSGQATLEWQVSDSGIGISQSQQIHLFEPFYQVRDASSEAGSGLGLPICWKLSEMMHGQMKVVSEPGLGSSFSLVLSLKTPVTALDVRADRQPSMHAVYVKAPVQELAQSICDWLNRLGITAHVAPASLEQKHQDSILVDVLPSEGATSWTGPRIRCLSDRSDRPAYPTADWEVDAYDIRAIAHTVSRVQQGTIGGAFPPSEPAGVKPLGLHILVAEDNPLNQAIIKEQLEALGCTVITACNGEQALHHWQPNVFDLVLTDVNMPLINGYELANALRKRDPQIPIIGVTANAMREEGSRCIAVGMNCWLVKPLSLQTLRDQLSKLCKTSTQALATEAEPLPSTVPPRIQADTMIQLSPKMRELFVTTMQQDMQRLNAALDSNDHKTGAERLHSMAGAMGAVQAGALAKACAELECRLQQNGITPPLLLEVKQIMLHISDIVATLE